MYVRMFWCRVEYLFFQPGEKLTQRHGIFDLKQFIIRVICTHVTEKTF